MVLMAGDDEVIPRKRTDALISEFDPKILTVNIIKGAGHNTISMFPEFIEDLRSFFSEDSGKRKYN